MSWYSYRCDVCGLEFELSELTDKLRCGLYPDCMGFMRRIYKGFNFRLSRGGWRATRLNGCPTVTRDG